MRLWRDALGGEEIVITTFRNRVFRITKTSEIGVFVSLEYANGVISDGSEYLSAYLDPDELDDLIVALIAAKVKDS